MTGQIRYAKHEVQPRMNADMSAANNAGSETAIFRYFIRVYLVLFAALISAQIRGENLFSVAFVFAFFRPRPLLRAKCLPLAQA